MTSTDLQDSRYSWFRLMVSLVIATISGIGLWIAVLVLPALQGEFGVDRAGASVPYTATMLGFGLGGALLGRVADRFGIMVPLAGGGLALAAGLFLAAAAPAYWVFVAAQALLIGVGSATAFAPLLADVSLWFRRRRGIAIAIVASGNYLAGAVWPPILTASIAAYGWRMTYAGVGVFVLLTMLPLTLLLRRRASLDEVPTAAQAAARNRFDGTPLLYGLLILAGVACCVAMAMPQVHLVAYCIDLRYGAARGSEMLSLLLACGIVSRLASGALADRFGGKITLIVGSLLQLLALLLYVPFDGLASLYLVSALFGLSQGGIVPSYALIIRDHFPAREAGTRISVVLTATVLGMALGGWLSGEIFDATGSYRLAFLHGAAWNLLNLLIAAWLLLGPFGRGRKLAPAAGQLSPS